MFGVLIFSEPMTPGTAIGMAIIAAAGMLVVARQGRQKSAA
jgi:drug/metabolite transporter (DMT)-like permease